MVIGSQSNWLGPVAIGGVGGSGTRVGAEILIHLGFYMGKDLNSANDNLWFTLLFKRPRWFLENSEKNESQIVKGLSIFEKAMTLIRSKKPDTSRYIGWGWKEPNTHIYIELLDKYFQNLKYIHLIRHGIDMAYSSNQSQVYNWGTMFGIKADDPSTPLPKLSLKYWNKANRRAMDFGYKLLRERFLVVNFDKLCTNPWCEIERLIDFLGIDPKHINIHELV